MEVPADRGEIFTILSTSNTGKQLKVKIDTGAGAILSRSVLQYIDPDAHVDDSHVVNLVAYGGQIIRTLGVTDVNFTCGTLQFHVVDSDCKTSIGPQRQRQTRLCTSWPKCARPPTGGP